MNDVSNNWTKLFAEEGSDEDLNLKKEIDNLLGGWKSSADNGLIGMVSSYAALKLEQEKPEPLTRKVLCEKTEKHIWVFNDFLSSMEINLDKIMKDTILLYALTSTFKNTTIELNSEDEKSSV